MPTLPDAATLTRRGWSVFPIQPNGKTPLTRHGFKDATTDHQTITAWWRRWPDANIGVATGTTSGIYVIDLDGPEGVNTWTALTHRHGKTPATLIAQTGGGGFHLIYQAPGALPNTASRLGPKIDTRGDGGYIVAPPSTHPNGNPYQWANNNTPAPLPTWIRDALTPKRTSQPPTAPRRADGDTPYGLAALHRHITSIRTAPDGQRNDTLNRAAFSVGQLIAGGELTPHGIRDALTAAAAAAGLPRHEAEQTIRSGLTAGHQHPWAAPNLDVEPPRITVPRIETARL